ncbi:MAG: alpha/beta fold hydrolase [Actinomycetia bacterium]|nr:alpha/beta fold hydrolase [Actinomycetes bacterium]MCH9801767.1 alpha/beta fold hydrolase [Actinomycetes bacterium]
MRLLSTFGGVSEEEITTLPSGSVGSLIRQAARRRAIRARQTTKRSAAAVFSARGLRGTAVEFAWLSTHVAMYPLGLAEEKVREEVERHNLEGLPPVQRGLFIGDVEAAGTPIILVHGVVDNRSVFALLRRGLRKRGFGRVVTLNYSRLSTDVREVAAQLAETIDAVARETGYERVHVIGHSMGGLIGRYYVQRMGGDRRVHTLVTLGSPHEGSTPARMVPVGVFRQLRPGSDVLQEMAEPAPDCRTRFLAVWSDLDQVIIPKRNARITHPDLKARNVFFRGVGHMSLPVDGRVVHEICTTLAHLGHDGSILTEGATSITSSRSARREQRQRTKLRLLRQRSTG